MSPRPSSKKEQYISFEQATARLEAIVDKINHPDTGLEEMISLVEEGHKLIKSSRKLLTEAELRIQQLETPDSSISTLPPAAQQNNDFSLI